MPESVLSLSWTVAAARFLFFSGNSDNGMIYDLPLQQVGVAVGLVLIALHAVALVRPGPASDWLRKFPRSPIAGRILLTVAALWVFLLVATMDLGEFSHLRRLLMLVVPAIYLMALYFVEDFLAVRGLAMVLLLTAQLLLDAAFLREPVTRLLLHILAYIWILLSLFWVGMPYLLRDQIQWLTSSPARFRLATTAGLVYGVATFVCALLFYGHGS